jgi:hypothetical protein
LPRARRDSIYRAIADQSLSQYYTVSFALAAVVGREDVIDDQGHVGRPIDIMQEDLADRAALPDDGEGVDILPLDPAANQRAEAAATSSALGAEASASIVGGPMLASPALKVSPVCSVMRPLGSIVDSMREQNDGRGDAVRIAAARTAIEENASLASSAIICNHQM